MSGSWSCSTGGFARSQQQRRSHSYVIPDPSSGYDLKKLLKAFKKEFACNGTLVDDEELGQVIQLQGDQRQKVSSFL